MWFTDQSDKKTIIGQEGGEMEIQCTSSTAQNKTSLQIITDGTVKAISDNQSVSYLFIPDKTDHLTIYKCTDSSIMQDVTILIRCKYILVLI